MPSADVPLITPATITRRPRKRGTRPLDGKYWCLRCKLSQASQPNLLAKFPELARQSIDDIVCGCFRPSCQTLCFFLERQHPLRRFPYTLGEPGIALGRPQQFLVSTIDELFLVANEAEIATRSNVLYRRLLDGGGRQHTSHFHIIGGDQAAITDFVPQNLGDPFPGEGSRGFLARNLWVGRMRNHHERELAPQGSIWSEILAPHFFKRLLDHWQIVMAVEIAFAQAREMLAAAHDSGGTQASQKFARVQYRLPGIVGYQARVHDAARCFKGQVDGRGEVHIEP